MLKMLSGLLSMKLNFQEDADVLKSIVFVPIHKPSKPDESRPIDLNFMYFKKSVDLFPVNCEFSKDMGITDCISNIIVEYWPQIII